MKKIVGIASVLSMVLVLAACGNGEATQPGNAPVANTAGNATSDTAGDAAGDVGKGTAGAQAGAGNILIAYFSYPMDEGVDAVTSASRTVYDDGSLGNTNYAANLIREATGGTMFAIEPEDGHYQTDDFMAMAEFARDEIDNKERPVIRTQIDNLDDYDTIFVGYPIWWYDMPAIMYTFFDTYDFGGKTIIPFTTHGGSRLSGTVETIQELEPDAAVVTDAFTVSREDVKNAREDVKEWVDSLGLGQ